MKLVVQRAAHGQVVVEGETVGSIGMGLVILVGVGRGDTVAQVEALAKKVVNLRIFPDDAGRMNRSLMDVGGEILAVSQFTLYADLTRGRRPFFGDAEDPEPAAERFESFVAALKALGVSKVDTGRFGTEMQVTLLNSGPVTLILDA